MLLKLGETLFWFSRFGLESGISIANKFPDDAFASALRNTVQVPSATHHYAQEIEKEDKVKPSKIC